jgi:hypothetical protein
MSRILFPIFSTLMLPSVPPAQPKSAPAAGATR